ncbi:carbonyl reductase family member 4-like [Ptychodera flava]|uniref:carbonyl reductase family member 4-like n=1 Tax=Ptychodera flava TaxID=63121 RepID=UPI003969E34E
MSRVCAVFGGSRGIGAAISKAFAREGENVVILAKNVDRIEATLESLNKIDGGGTHTGLICNISSETDVKTRLSQVYDKYGRIDILVNSAGITKDSLLLRTSKLEVSDLLELNLIGPMITSRVVLKEMIRQQDGCIINIGSIVGLKGNIGQSSYGASKAGLLGFTRCLAKEVASRNIRVNLIAPGFIKTDMTGGSQFLHMENHIPMGRFGDPTEVANAAVFLANSPYITGQMITVDGGLQLAI